MLTLKQIIKVSRLMEQTSCNSSFRTTEPQTVYAFEFNSWVFDSGFLLVSLHTTKAGAYRAMMEHKRRLWYYERDRRWGDASEIGLWQAWRIKEYRVQD